MSTIEPHIVVEVVLNGTRRQVTMQAINGSGPFPGRRARAGK